MTTTKPPAPHDFSVSAPGVSIVYCSRCAQPDLVAIKRTPCRPIPAAEAEQQIARKLRMVKLLRPMGGGTQ